MRNGVSLIPRDSLPNAKWCIALGNTSQVVNEKVTPNRYRCAADGNLGISPILYAPLNYQWQPVLHIR
jgi:hypothetical protein